jgi:RimJ/RimL family protein N-acetyltransferase
MYMYKDLGFRPIEREDLDALKELHNDQSTFLNLATIHMVDDDDQEAWWEIQKSKKGDERYSLIRQNTDKEELIGRLRIVNIDNANRNCEVGLDILPHLRGQGLGKKSYYMVLEYLFMHQNMNMVYLKAADYNPEAIGLYEKVGFRHTGYLKVFLYRHGKYWNYIIMCITKDEYLS